MHLFEVLKRNIRGKFLPNGQVKDNVINHYYNDFFSLIDIGHLASLKRVIGKLMSRMRDHKAKHIPHKVVI